MKLDAMTIGAVGFAAFAAFTVLKKKPSTSTATSTSGAFEMATAQRREVGSALYQNNLFVTESLGLKSPFTPADGYWFL